MNTNMNRRNFLGLSALAGASVAFSGCQTLFGPRVGKVAVQLYSIGAYIKKVGLEKALADVRAIGYEGVEFAGYYDFKPCQLKKMLADNGLAVAGTHISNSVYGFDTKNWKYDPEILKKTCDFELAYGNVNVLCPGGGNAPAVDKVWSARRDGKTSIKLNDSQADFVKRLCDLYNKAAVDAAKLGCKIGLHNHTWEFGLVMPDGSTYWDYFFSHTDSNVCMEQDVGWTTCAGFDPCEQYAKYPHRSPTLHAKENGMGPAVTKFDAILGQPGQPGAIPVDWDKLFPVTDADGVEWYVVECEKHFDTLEAIKPSWEFLHAKGRC